MAFAVAAVIRRQLPAHSPVSFETIVGAAAAAVRAPEGSRRELATQLVERFGAARALLTGSGTQALTLAMNLARAIARRERLVVALPAYSCFDLVSAAEAADVRVVFYDLDPSSLTPDESGLRSALAAGASVVVVSNLFGFPVDWDRVRSLCRDAGALLIEDAAQGLGSGWMDSPWGTFGDLTVLSFARGKGWTGGAGGALLVRVEHPDAEHAETQLSRNGGSAIGSIKSLVTTVGLWGLGRPFLFWIPSGLPLRLGETQYRPPVPPASIHAFGAAAALRHLPLALDAVTARRETAEALRTLWRDEPLASSHPRPCGPLEGGQCGYLRFPILASDPTTARTLVRAGAGLGLARGYPKSLPTLPAARPLEVARSDSYPGAERLASTLITLPTHSFVSSGDIDRIGSCLASVSCHES